MRTQHTTQEKGIVLLEAIVAIGVLVMIAGAVLVLVIRSTSGTRSATDQLTATYLAQDVAEWLVAKKQYNIKNNVDWHTEMQCGVGTECGVDTNDLADLQDCTSLNACALFRDATTGLYSHTLFGNVPTPYVRKVTGINASSDLNANGILDNITYTITVSWTNGARTESLPLTLTLYED
ncbi:MAG: hypothetical protein KBD21_05490 [Candidatus Pacebacteria bacterium]|nr:hypothetical protein [Candidatus Paceibacterota bacterium]